jgi:hypothetical protein
MKIEQSTFDFHDVFRPAIPSRLKVLGIFGEERWTGSGVRLDETDKLVGGRADLQAGEGVVVEVHADVLRQ